MSTILKEHLEEVLFPEFDADTNSFTSNIQEEYLTTKGWLDRDYICHKLGISLSLSSFRKVVKQQFDTVDFKLLTPKCEVSKEEFEKVYVFGQYKDMREWIPVIKATYNKHIDKQTLYRYILGE